MCFYGKLQHLIETLWSEIIAQRTISSLPRPMCSEHFSFSFYNAILHPQEHASLKEDNHNLIIYHYGEQSTGHLGFTYATYAMSFNKSVKWHRLNKQDSYIHCRFSGQRSVVFPCQFSQSNYNHVQSLWEHLLLTCKPTYRSANWHFSEISRCAFGSFLATIRFSSKCSPLQLPT